MCLDPISRRRLPQLSAAGAMVSAARGATGASSAHAQVPARPDASF